MTNPIEKEILFDVIKNPGDTFYENVLSDLLDEQGIDHDFRKPLHNNSVIEPKPYQEKCLAVWANRWTNIGLCTSPTDEKKAEQYFSDFYKELGFSKPKSIIWFNNPVELCSQVLDQVNNQLLDRTRFQLWSQVWYQTWCKVADLILNPLKNQILDRLKNRAANRIRNQVWVQVKKQVWTKIKNGVNDQVWSQVWYQRAWHGQYESDGLAFYSYCMQVLRVEFPKPFVPYILLTQEVNWWFSTEQTVYVVRKPKECFVKDEEVVKVVYQDNYTIT
jgi:hypothetical protein